MKIELKKIKVREITNGFADNDENGVVGYKGKLDIRPPYQREFIYKDKQRDAVIVDEKQNENVKDLMKDAIYADEKTRDNMASWLIWLYDNLEEKSSSKPMVYDGLKTSNLGMFRPLYRANK